MMRHAFLTGGPGGLGLPAAISAIMISVVEASFRRLLMASARSAELPLARLLPTRIAAIAMSAVTVGADVEHFPALGGNAEFLMKACLVWGRHREIVRGQWTTAAPKWQHLLAC
jgi:hypothetical protein